MKVTTIGIDVAKSVFQVHGIDEDGKVALRRQLRRAQVLLFFSNLEPCLIGIEACASSHHWARKLSALGHTVRLMAPQFVKAYRKNDKNDGNDAEAICEAVQRPSMRFVPVKSPQQQAELAVHRIRQRLMGERTALINQLRGLLAEFGLVLATGASQVRSKLPAVLENAEGALPPLALELFRELYEELRQLEQRIAEHDRRIERLYRGNGVARKLAEVEGIGPLTATAFTATVAHAVQFKNGRQCAAWLGLTPRQDSTGGKNRLLGITKRGDVYLRTLLVHGARSIMRHTAKRDDPKSRWVEQLRRRRGDNVAACALAAKHARILWALMAREQVSAQKQTA
ncbi:MAG: IS110 family transposase [Pseudonocardiaceae bacterium]